MDMEQRIRGEIERRALGGDLERAASLLGYAKEVGLCLSPPDLFERELSLDPLAGHFYRCRARVKWRADLREEALVDMTRALLVAQAEERLLEEVGLIRDAASVEPLASWARHALASIYHRLDGTPDSEWRHLVAARDGSDDVAVHVRMAEVRRDRGDEGEVAALSAVLEQAPGWLDGWLRLIVARTRSGDELGAHRALEQLQGEVHPRHAAVPRRR